MPITPSLRHCSNKYKLAREGEKDKDFGKKGIFFIYFLSSQVELKEMSLQLLLEIWQGSSIPDGGGKIIPPARNTVMLHVKMVEPKTMVFWYRLPNNKIIIMQYFDIRFNVYILVFISGGPLSALTCCVNVRLLSAIKKISPLIYSQSWVGSWVYTTQAMMTFTLIF